MTSCQTVVEKLFMEKPNLTRDEALEELRKIKDDKTGKSPWDISTMRNRVDAYLGRKKRAEQNVMGTVDTEPTEDQLSATEITKQNVIVEKREPIVRRKQDIFSPDDDVPEIVKPEKEFEGDLPILMKELERIVTETTKEIMDRVDASLKETKNEIAQTRRDLEKKIALIGKLPEEEVEYDEIELRKSTIDGMKDEAVALKFDDISDYIDELRKTFSLYTSALENYIEPYNTFVGAVLQAENSSMVVKCSVADGKLVCNEYKMPEVQTSKPKFRLVVLAAFLGLGIALGSVITYVVISFLK